MALAGDIIVAADNTRFCQMEAKRGIAPLGGAHFRIERAGWGNGMYHLLLCDEFDAAASVSSWPSSRGSPRWYSNRPGNGACKYHQEECTIGHSGNEAGRLKVY